MTVWPDFDVGRTPNWGMEYMSLKYLLLGWCGQKYESYTLHAESFRLVWTKYESYILHTSAVMYIFQT